MARFVPRSWQNSIHAPTLSRAPLTVVAPRFVTSSTTGSKIRKATPAVRQVGSHASEAKANRLGHHVVRTRIRADQDFFLRRVLHTDLVHMAPQDGWCSVELGIRLFEGRQEGGEGRHG